MLLLFGSNRFNRPILFTDPLFSLVKRKWKHRLCTGYHGPWSVYKTLRQLVRGVFFPNTFEMWLNTRRKLTVYHKKEEEEALGPDKFLNGRISYLCKPFTRNRPNSVPDGSTLFTSPYKYLHSFITRMAETCAVPRVPCKRKADPCKFLSVQKFVRTRFIRRLSLFYFQCRWVRLAPPMGPWFPLAISEVRVIKAVKSRY